MKTLIYQVAVGQVPHYYEVCIQSAIEYAKRIGADHRVLREPQLKIRPLKSARSSNAVERLGYLPIYEKENAFNHLDEYDAIAIIDSDIFIRESAPNIFDQLGDAVFAGVRENTMPLTPEYMKKIKAYSKGQYDRLTDVKWQRSPAFGVSFYNMGLMLFSSRIADYLNGETPEQFIRRPEFERFVNGEGSWRWSTDQTLLNYWVQKTKMPTKDLDWRWNALFKGVQDKYLSDAHFIHFFLAANLPKKGEEIPSIIKNLNHAKAIKGHR